MKLSKGWGIHPAEKYHRSTPPGELFSLFLIRKMRRPPCESLSLRTRYQSVLKEINPEYSLEGLMLMLKLKLQYFSHLIQRANSLEKTLMLGKIEGRKRSR